MLVSWKICLLFLRCLVISALPEPLETQLICDDGELLYWLKKSFATHSDHKLIQIEGKCRKFEDCSGDCWWAKNGCEADIIPLVATAQKDSIYVAGVRFNSSTVESQSSMELLCCASLQYTLRDCIVKFYAEDQQVIDLAQIQQDWRRFGFGRSKTVLKDITIDQTPNEIGQIKTRANVCKAVPKEDSAGNSCPYQQQSESTEDKVELHKTTADTDELATTAKSVRNTEGLAEVQFPTATVTRPPTLEPLIKDNKIERNSEGSKIESCKLPKPTQNSIAFVGVNNQKVNSSSYSIGTELALVCDEGWVTRNSYYQVLKCADVDGKNIWIPTAIQPCSVVRTSTCCIVGLLQWKYDADVVNCVEDANVVNTCKSEFTDCGKVNWTCFDGFWSKEF